MLPFFTFSLKGLGVGVEGRGRGPVTQASGLRKPLAHLAKLLNFQNQAFQI